MELIEVLLSCSQSQHQNSNQTGRKVMHINSNIGGWSEREVCETGKDETIKILLNIRKIQIKNHHEVSHGTANSLNKRLYNFFSL